jgi:hypothetical protein
VIASERSRSKFCRNEKKNAERANLRVATNLPAHEADNGFELSVRERFIEAIRESCRQEASGRTGAHYSSKAVWPIP